jgi:8-amino-7-oxononanoate synthase
VTKEIQSDFEKQLAELSRQGRSREIVLLRDDLADFASNDYLGLARNKEIIDAARQAISKHGTGARASRLLGGGAALDRQAEEALADWLGAEAALLFATGFQANLGLLTALVQRGDVLFSDQLNHASLIDAARLAGGRCVVFAHNDCQDLEARLAGASGARRRWVVSEGVFSMDGDLAPLVEISRLCKKYDAGLLVDEAHAAGVVGPAGAGAWAAALAEGAEASVLVARTVPCGKALGAQGGFVAGSRALIEVLLTTARSFVFSTGVAPAISGALVAAIALARDADGQREDLHARARELAQAVGLEAPTAAILPILVGESAAALDLAEKAQAAGFEVRAVRPPTVPAGSARLRIVLHAFNSRTEVARLAQHIGASHASQAQPKTPSRKPLVVVGTDTDIGKTVVSALFVRAAASIGEVCYWKPVQTGSDSDTETVRRLCADSGAVFKDPHYSFPLPASPHEAAEDAGAHILPGALEEDLSALQESFEGEVVVELAGGLCVPYDERETQADFLARQQPRIVLVARSGLGTLNHTLLTLEALRARKLEPLALVLVGDEHPSNSSTLRRMGGVRQVFEVPFFDPLSKEALDEWLAFSNLAGVFDA